MRNKKNTFIVSSLALFSMFFGAGNMIFPPALGRWAGEGYIWSIIGFLTTSVGIVMLALTSTTLAGGHLEDVARPLGDRIAKLFGMAIVLAIGPGLAIPRTAATTFEMLEATLIPNLNPLVGSLIFFSVVLFLTLNPAGVINSLGKFLTPALVVSVGLIVIKGIISPLGAVLVTDAAHPFSHSFEMGYQTMDGLAAFVFTGLVIKGFEDIGITDKKEQASLTIKAGLLAGGLLALIYGGLLYIGATTTSIDLPEMTRVELLAYIADKQLGKTGLYVLAIAMTLACLTTAIGLSASVGDFFERYTKGKLKRKGIIVVSVVFSAILAVRGVESIVNISAPILEFIYPIAIVLVFLNLARQEHNRPVFLGAVYGTTLYSILYFLDHLKILKNPLGPIYRVIPDMYHSFLWVAFALAGLLLFVLIDIVKNNVINKQH